MAFQPFRNFGQPFARAFGRGGGGGVLYLLQDLFTTARAAGSVNGTAAEPTGQTRTVTDTNNVLSIAGGLLSFATGGVGSANPIIAYPSVVRVSGKMLLFQFTVSSAPQGIGGWGSTNSGLPEEGFAFTTTTISARVAGSNKLSAVIVVGTTYTVCVIMRATGHFYFIKGGAFTFWSLLFISAVTSLTPEFPVLTVVTSTDIYTADNIRVPVTLYIPSPLAYDTFTRANGALGSTETTSPDGVAIAALVWNFTAGKWAIVTNVAVGTPTQGADVVVDGGMSNGANWTQGAGWTVAAGLATATAASANLTAAVAPLTLGVWYQTIYDLSAFAAGTVRIRVGGTNMPTHAANATYTETNRAQGTSLVFVGAGFTGSIDNVVAKPLTLADLFASVLVSTADVIADVAVTLVSATDGKQAGLVLNLDSTVSPANFILVYLDGQGNVQCDECIAGVYTAKQTTAITYSAGAVLRVERSGTELRVFYNNAAAGAVITMTANINKNHGLFSTSPLNSLDNWTCWSRGTGGEYEGLSAF